MDKQNRGRDAPRGDGDEGSIVDDHPSQSRTSQSQKSKRSSSSATMNISGDATITSITAAQQPPPHHSTPKRASLKRKMGRANNNKDDVFEDEYELGTPSSLRQLQDEGGIDMEEGGSYRHANSRKNRPRRRPQLLLESATTTTKSNSNRCCQCLCLTILVQILIGAVLLIVVLIWGSSSSATLSSSPEDYSSLGVQEPFVLPPPPSNIHHYCTKDKMLDPSARMTCAEMCDRSHCCKYSYRSDRGCWRDNQDSCNLFLEACAVLKPIQPTNNTLREDDPITTVMPNALVLWGNPNILPPAPAQLSSFCQAAAFWGQDEITSEEVSGAEETCHEVCNSARCCWDQTLINPADRCWIHPECRLYEEACSSLIVLESPRVSNNATTTVQLHSALQDAPANITEYCLPDSIHTDLKSLLRCQEVCLPAECCWNSALLVQCGAASTSGNGKCDGYKAACAILNTPLVVREPPSETALITTTTTTTTTNVSTERNSWLENEPENTELPQGYTSEIIRGACLNHDNAINEASGRITLCEQVCQPGSCCFSQSTSQNSGDISSMGADETDLNTCPAYLPNDYCDKFAACRVIFAPSQSNIQQVQQACSNLSDLSDCVTVCAKVTCCFTNNPWRACAATDENGSSTNCEEFSSCEILYQGIAQASDRGDNRNLRAEAPQQAMR